MRLTEPQKFTAISGVITAAVILATSITQSSFYRDAIMLRESAVMRDMVAALVLDQEADHNLSMWDLANFRDAGAQAKLNQSFGALKKLPGFALTKVFNVDRIIVWSNQPQLVGARQSEHPLALAQTIATNEVAFFILPPRGSISTDLIEFYIPFSLAASSNKVSGVLALYRSANDLEATIQNGLHLLWLATGIGGLVLYGALYRLFQSVHASRGEIQSKLKRLSAEQNRLIQLEKLSAMGQMVGEIAHQLNNPLVGVVNLAELAEREIDDKDRVRTLLGEVRKAGNQCREFVRRVLALSKVSRAEPQPTDLVELAQDTIAFCRQSLPHGAPIEFEAPHGSAMVNVDPVLMQHALFNVARNAEQADPTGPITISIAPAERNAVAGFDMSICDRGPGISDQIREKLFVPFFTTRPGGTGLGLAIAQYIIVLHDGAISTHNRAGGGACFTIWLPASRAKT